MSEPIITFDKVNKWYGNNFHVLRDIDLSVAKGERIVICGPSGSGKSTLIRCINRLEEHQQGTLKVDGVELTDDVKAVEAIRTLCVLYVELIRGVPLISVLFMASFMFPLFMPPGTSIDVLLRVLVGITLFAAAYMAEIVRGGLQAIPKGQQEAADTLGLSYWQAQRKIILPQALALVVPGIMNNFISIFKDTSLVTIVSLYELTGAMGLALNSDADWRPFKIEAYLFIAAIYFVFCFSMSRYSLWIEKRLSLSKNR